MPKKVITFLHYTYPPRLGGVETMMKRQADFLTQKEYKVRVIVAQGEETNKAIELIKVPEFGSLHNLRPKLMQKILAGQIDEEFFSFARVLQQKIKKLLQNTDTVIIHNMLTLRLNMPFAYAFKQFAEENPRIKIICWVHDHCAVEGEKIKKYLSNFEKKLYSQPIKNIQYVVISHTFLHYLKKVMKLDEKKVKIIYNGIYLKDFLVLQDDLYRFILNNKILSFLPLVLCPVNILIRKKLDLALDVFKELLNFYKNAGLIITGYISPHRLKNKEDKNHLLLLKKKSRQKRLAGKIFFLYEEIKRSLQEKEVASLYQIADVVFLLSKNENFGLPIIESLFFKTPILTSHLKVFQEVDKEHIILTAKNESPEKIAQRLCFNLQKNKIIDGHKTIKEKYILENIYQSQLLALLK